MSKATSLSPSLSDSMKEQPSDLEQAPVTEKEQGGEPTTEAVSPWHPSQFPDGGKDAWLCLLGAFCCLFCSFGWINCIGVFQQYYQLNQLKDFSASSISWIASLEIFIMFVPGPIVGFFFDNYGPRYLLIFGTFFHVFGIMMTSLCTKYWQFILAQGICSPLGLNCIFNAATNSLVTWFFKKRGLAFGVNAAGSGLGGVLFPIITSHLIPQVGYGWTMRINGFIMLALLGIASVTIKSRLPPTPRPFQPKVFAEPFKDTRFVLVAIASFIFFLGIFIPINFIEVLATSNGMSHYLSTYLVSILNAASIFGRIIPGALADKLGRFNMQVIMSFFAGIVVLALALPASSNAAFIAFAALYGFASGAYVAITPAQIAYIAPMAKIGVYTGVLFSTTSFAGLIGNPIAGAIAKRGTDFVIVFAGVMLLAGAAVFLLTRMYIAKWQFMVRV